MFLSTSISYWRDFFSSSKFIYQSSTKMQPLLLIESPHLHNYDEFFSAAVQKFPSETSGLDVLVTTKLADSSQLNMVLSTLYTQIRKRLFESHFTYDFDIQILVNKWPSYSIENHTIFHIKRERIPDCLLDFETVALDVPIPDLSIKEKNTSPTLNFCSVDSTAVGGTFDHLHDGHKILLSMAAFVARRRLIIGVTGPELLRKKKYSSALQSFDTRVKKICQFLRKLLHDDQFFEVYEINDIYGPTGFIPEIDSLVISEETSDGATTVNLRRADLGFSHLAVLCVRVIGGEGDGHTKLSSTELRKIQLQKTSVNSYDQTLTM